jgi:hypothetical protein
LVVLVAGTLGWQWAWVLIPWREVGKGVPAQRERLQRKVSVTKEVYTFL